METRLSVQPKTAPTPSFTPVRGGVLQRKCACGGTSSGSSGGCEACRKKKLQRRAVHPSPFIAHPSGVPPIVHDVLRSPGQPLDAAARAFMERRFNHDFANVRVYHDARAAESARAVDALAYTVGRNIVFGEGQYSTRESSSAALLAHELTHVVQQSRRGSGQDGSLQFGDRDGAHELEANRVSKSLLAGKAVNVEGSTNTSVQGWSWGGAGLGALAGGLLGAGLGAFGGGLGALIGLGAGILIGGLIGGLAAGSEELSEAQKQCKGLLDKIRQHPVYRALAAAARALADEIIDIARGRSNCLYYAAKLKLLFDTPDAPPALPGQPPPAGSTLERNRQRVEAAAEQERVRLATPEAQAQIGRQEQIADAAQHFEPRIGQNGKTFLVDRSDPKNIVVRIKVRLQAAPGVTTATDIANERLLEDAIERVAEMHGYTVDVVFVDADGPDVFSYMVDFDKWPTSANPVGNARTLAHEIHHLMGLPDRYDYIEAHAANPNMAMPRRLYWFREQMNRQPDPKAGESLMGSGQTLLDDDVCRVAGLDAAACAAARAQH
jgi:uncharacterized protein DUF4157